MRRRVPDVSKIDAAIGWQPSTSLDTTIDQIIADETGKEEWQLYRAGLDGLDFRTRNLETLDEIERDALDFYARLRSLYRQRRDAEIRNEVGEQTSLDAEAISQRNTQMSQTK